MADPNPEAADGAERLRAAGIAVDVGLLEDEARELNIGFVSRDDARPAVGADEDRGEPRRPHRARRPANRNGSPGEAARADGHRWRARACAILTGIGTVRQDDPQLTVRAVATPRQPRRIVVDRHARDAAGRARARRRRRADRHRGRAQSALAGRRRGAALPDARWTRRSRRADARARRARRSTSCTSRPARGSTARCSRRAWSTSCCSISRRACSAIRRAASSSCATALARLADRVALAIHDVDAHRRGPAHRRARRANGAADVHRHRAGGRPDRGGRRRRATVCASPSTSACSRCRTMSRSATASPSTAAA